MHFGKIMAAYSDESMRKRNTLCGKITGTFNAKAYGR
jgi:hypothetical protein